MKTFFGLTTCEKNHLYLGTAKVLGSYLTRTCFFFQTGIFLFQLQLSANYFVSLSIVGLVVTSSVFFAALFFFDVAFSV